MTKDEPEHETEEKPRLLTEIELAEFLHEKDEEQEKKLNLRALPLKHSFWLKKDGKLYVAVINDGPETGRSVVVSVEYAGGTFGGDPDKGIPPESGKQNHKFEKGWKKGESIFIPFTLPNDDCWNPDLLFDITVDTGGDSEKNITVIVDKKDK